MLVHWLLALICTMGCIIHTEGDLNSDIGRAESQVHQMVKRRSRRYVVFPEGSTFNAAFCITIKSTTGPDPIFTEGINWAVSYDLPNETIRDTQSKYEFPVLIRRHKRDLYQRMEKLIDSAGMDGSQCVLNTICETGHYLLPRQGILQEIFRILFTNRRDKEDGTISKRDNIYGDAYERGVNKENCRNLYPCPISILNMGLEFATFSI